MRVLTIDFDYDLLSCIKASARSIVPENIRWTLRRPIFDALLTLPQTGSDRWENVTNDIFIKRIKCRGLGVSQSFARMCTEEGDVDSSPKRKLYPIMGVRAFACSCLLRVSSVVSSQVLLNQRHMP